MMNPIRIRLRYADLDTFVAKFAPNVTRGGVFLASRNIQAVGTVIPFEIQLTGGEIVLAGQGRVTWVKEFNPNEPHRPYGMGVQFMSVEPMTMPILARILRAKEFGTQRRSTTGPLLPLGSAGAGGAQGQRDGNNGKRSVPAIDTSVDLAVEYGLEEQALRHIIERTWMTGARPSGDLADLLRPEPVETVTLAQALSELPRLLDPQYSRRRASGTFRETDVAREARAPVLDVGSIAAGTTWPTETALASENTSADGDPTIVATRVIPAAETTQQSPISMATHSEVGKTGDEGGDGGAVDSRTNDFGDATDMTGERRDHAESMQAVPAEAVAASAGHGRSGRKRRR
jgi:uncharacterized protein (TIGR02266 family)